MTTDASRNSTTSKSFGTRMLGTTWAVAIGLAVSASALAPVESSTVPDELTLLTTMWDDASALEPAPDSTASTDSSLSVESSLTTSMTTSMLAPATSDSLSLDSSLAADLLPADLSWLTELNGWTPNLSSAIDSRASRRSLTGAGIDIALIDSGISPVLGLAGPNKIVNGPDLSEDGADSSTRHIDGFGHGTHLAGIIAGNDGGVRLPGQPSFSGIAPNARLVNVKVANREGEASLEQLVAGIEWVIANKNSNGLNIRVLSLSFGYDGLEDLADPISAALEEAWAQGIVVVVAGGNDGNGSNGLDHPAVDPYVMAIAGSDQLDPFSAGDDIVASWSSSGDTVRNPDLIAPGRSIVSLRVPGSWADVNFPESEIGTRFAVASGTSQATAVTSGAVALMLQANPSLSPDQVKRLFTSGASSIVNGENLDGHGRLELNNSFNLLKRNKQGAEIQQHHERLSVPEGFGTAEGGWSGSTWSGAGWSGAGWSGAGWSGSTWSGSTWSGAGWSGAGWSGAGWS